MRKKGLRTVGVLFTLVLVGMFATGATVSPGKISPQAETTIYFDASTFGPGEDTLSALDTLVWAKTRSFTDTSYDIGVFAFAGTAVGILGATILDDSTIIFRSAAGDSTKTYWYMVVLQRH